MFVVCRNRVLAVDTRTHQIDWDDRITLLDKAEAVWNKAISQDGRTIYLYSDRGTLIKYDVRRRRFTKPIPPLPRQSTMMYRGALMSLSGNGTKLVIAQNIQATSGIHSSSQFRVFDTRDWHLMAQFSVPIPITSLTVDTNGKKLYSVIDRYSSANPHPNDTFVEIDTEQGRVCAQHVRPGEHLADILFRE